MWTLCLLLSLCASQVEGNSIDIVDFDTFIAGFEFIFHDSHDLLLMKNSETCYFISVPDYTEGQLDSFHANQRERHFSYIVQHNTSGSVRETTLAAVREKYHDILADFQCTDKRVFHVDIPTTTHAPTTTTAAPQHHHEFDPNFCLHHLDGDYRYPGDCHRYIVCTHHMTYVNECGTGTLFSASLQLCAFPHDVPECHSYNLIG